MFATQKSGTLESSKKFLTEIGRKLLDSIPSSAWVCAQKSRDVTAINKKLGTSLYPTEFVDALVDCINAQPNRYKFFLDTIWEHIRTGKWGGGGAGVTYGALLKSLGTIASERTWRNYTTYVIFYRY